MGITYSILVRTAYYATGVFPKFEPLCLNVDGQKFSVYREFCLFPLHLSLPSYGRASQAPAAVQVNWPEQYFRASIRCLLQVLPERVRMPTCTSLELRQDLVFGRIRGYRMYYELSLGCFCSLVPSSYTDDGTRNTTSTSPGLIFSVRKLPSTQSSPTTRCWINLSMTSASPAMILARVLDRGKRSTHCCRNTSIDIGCLPSGSNGGNSSALDGTPPVMKPYGSLASMQCQMSRKVASYQS